MLAILSGFIFWACPEYDTFGDNDVSPNIFRVNVDGTGEDQITDSNYGYKSSPYFSGGGNKIVYWRYDENYRLSIFVMDANGDNEQKITRD